MTEAERKKLNDQRLLLVNTLIRDKVARCLATLEYYGYRPLIDKDVFRHPNRQLELYRQRRTRVTWGFHCAQSKGGPASLAADIVDCERLWGTEKNPIPAGFWLFLGYAAAANGLNWGGFFGLPVNLRRGVVEVFSYIARYAQKVRAYNEAVEEAKKIHPFTLPIAPVKPDFEAMADDLSFGWDVAHVEISDMTIPEAKKKFGPTAGGRR